MLIKVRQKKGAKRKSNEFIRKTTLVKKKVAEKLTKYEYLNDPLNNYLNEMNGYMSEMNEIQEENIRLRNKYIQLVMQIETTIESMEKFLKSHVTDMVQKGVTVPKKEDVN